jgi:hypothetical protein
MAREQKFSASQREATQHIPEEDVANVPEVVAARRALTAAEKEYQTVLQPRLAAQRRLEELRAERAKAEKMLADAEASRAELALAITDGKLPEEMFRELLDTMALIRATLERIDLSIPAIEARFQAHSMPVERAAHSEGDARTALQKAIKTAKLELAVSRDA